MQFVSYTGTTILYVSTELLTAKADLQLFNHAQYTQIYRLLNITLRFSCMHFSRIGITHQCLKSIMLAIQKRNHLEMSTVPGAAIVGAPELQLAVHIVCCWRRRGIFSEKMACQKQSVFFERENKFELGKNEEFWRNVDKTNWLAFIIILFLASEKQKRGHGKYDGKYVSSAS